MGSLPGKVQTTLYADPEVLRAIKIISAKTGRPIYDVVDKALRQYIKSELSAAEVMVFGIALEKEPKNGVAAKNRKRRSKAAARGGNGRARKKTRPKSRSSS